MDILDEILVTDSELSDTEVDLVNMLKIQNKIDDIADGIADDTFKLKNTTPKQLVTMAFLAARLHGLADQHGFTDLVEACDSFVAKTGGVIKNIDDPNPNTRLLKNDTEDWILGGFHPVTYRYKLDGVIHRDTANIAAEL